jgi:hypothetical protein
VFASDDVLEDESDDCPWDVVQRSRWWDGPDTAEDNGEAARKYSHEKLLRDEEKKTHLTYRMKLFGHFKAINHATNGQSAPMRKKYTSASWIE